MNLVAVLLSSVSLECASFCQKGFEEEEFLSVVTHLQTLPVSTTESAILYTSSLASDISTISEVPPLHLIRNGLTCYTGLGLFFIIHCLSCMRAFSLRSL